MVGKTDDELTDLLAKLYGIQEDIGAKPKSSEEEKKSRAESVVTMGQGKKAQEKASKFLQLKGDIVDRLKSIHQMLKDIKEKEGAGFGGDNAKEIIKMQAEVRESLRQATDDWKELDEIYKKEARKKRSKFTPEELEVQAELVQRLYAEIEKVKEAQMKGYARGKGEATPGIPTKSLFMDSGKFFLQCGALVRLVTYCRILLFLILLFCFNFRNKHTANKKGGPSWKGTGGGVALTDGQQQQMLQIEERDADFDRQLDEIGEGIQDLAEIAEMQGEEVAHQTQMLDKLHTKMDAANERMVGVNTKMKDTLEEVGRSSDKLCVDIMCIVLMIGFIAVIYNFATG